MKKLIKIYFFLVMLLTVISCKKNDPNDIPTVPLAALTVTNVISQGKVVRINNNLVDSCLLNNYRILTLRAGTSTPIKAFASSSPNSPYYNQAQNTEDGGIYSLYLTGTVATPEAVFVKDNIPPYPKTEVINVRVVNLSPNAGPLNVTLASATTVNIFSNVVYKQVADFITLPLPMTVPIGTNVFQVRDAANVILFTYTLPTSGTVSIASSRHRNITLAVKGVIGGTGTDAIGIVPVPHY